MNRFGLKYKFVILKYLIKKKEKVGSNFNKTSHILLSLKKKKKKHILM